MTAADEVQIRRASPQDAEAIAQAHQDSIRSIGPAFYSADVVEAWGSGLTPAIYVKAMEGGEAFFVATGDLAGKTVVLGFSTHRVDALTIVTAPRSGTEVVLAWEPSSLPTQVHFAS
jgi:hypothetical protein